MRAIHSRLPNRLRAAVRAILDEAGPDQVGLREVADEQRVATQQPGIRRRVSAVSDQIREVFGAAALWAPSSVLDIDDG